ncbi:hypothetical protein [Sphingomonas faeni]|uniref:hypothetical protein n=1 Tax=Sphingomonas faeni TaxID=185950 RepID=UPI00335A7371
MTMTVNFSQGSGSLAGGSILGRATTDATAIPSVSGSATANSGTIPTADTGPFTLGDVVQIVGATQRFASVLRAINVNTSLTLNSGNRTLATEAVQVTRMEELRLYFDMPFTGRAVEWNDETNGITWTWRVGMRQGSALKRVWSTGVQTLELNVGLLLFINKLCLSSDVAPASSQFSFRIEG